MARPHLFCPLSGYLLELDATKGAAVCDVSSYSVGLSGAWSMWCSVAIGVADELARHVACTGTTMAAAGLSPPQAKQSRCFPPHKEDEACRRIILRLCIARILPSVTECTDFAKHGANGSSELPASVAIDMSVWGLSAPACRAIARASGASF
jgi:uncharacterized membrane protein YhiD involved in acid resistance